MTVEYSSSGGVPIWGLLRCSLPGLVDAVAMAQRQHVVVNVKVGKIIFQVTQIVRFLLEGGLRFRNLGFCGADMI